MKRRFTAAGCARALGFAAMLLALPACTLWDDYLPGTPFTPDQPEGEVTLVGEMHVDAISRSGDGCTPGRTVFWGLVRNTGDLDVADVSIAITAFDAGGGLVGTYSGDVYNGEIEEIELEDGSTVTVAGTSLTADPAGNGQSGSFRVCTPVPFGTAARTEYRTSFVTIEPVK